MTDDEAFIRAIVDSPGDDTPRLVYADWLEDRSDSRGPYLRAEREAVVRGDESGLGELAAGLDSVWVSRVSRPPVGVCCEHVGFEKRRPPTTNAALDAIERRFSLMLPCDYRAFLLNFNALWSDTGFYLAPWGYFYPLLYIFAVNLADGEPYDGPDDQGIEAWQIRNLDLAWRLAEIESGHSWPEWDDPVCQEFIPILCDDEESDGESGWLMLGVRGVHFGQVVKFGHDAESNSATIIPIATTFAAFLNCLVTADGAKPRRNIRRRMFEP